MDFSVIIQITKHKNVGSLHHYVSDLNDKQHHKNSEILACTLTSAADWKSAEATVEIEEDQPVNGTFLKDVVSINEREKDPNTFDISVIDQDILPESYFELELPVIDLASHDISVFEQEIPPGSFFDLELPLIDLPSQEPFLVPYNPVPFSKNLQQVAATPPTVGPPVVAAPAAAPAVPTSAPPASFSGANFSGAVFNLSNCVVNFGNTPK